MGEFLSFWFFAILSVGCALLSLFHKNVVHSAFALMGTLVGVAGLFLLLGADFLAMTQVLVYAGGILVLILFGLMLTRPEPEERNLFRIWGGVGILAAGALLFVERMGEEPWFIQAKELPSPEPTVREIGLELLRRDSWLFAFEFASVILLAALVAAAFIARRRFNREDVE
ncbi:MAG: NADH-quinone oxidoreductase subunit J [Planctomycetota bacterium]|jgi:NADH-quinone oxidoreductase subunit J|nr:NADH-quinone oxidoreductase subunit J [Planctomycetota bacterium]MDP6942023.1 NADH-quinone oxidoreductase subunit J [Planctomycetota bacterium]